MAKLRCIGGESDGRWIEETLGFGSSRGHILNLRAPEPLRPFTARTFHEGPVPLPPLDCYVQDSMRIPTEGIGLDEWEVVSFWREESLTIKEALQMLFKGYVGKRSARQ
jgi:hypothetical protein